jgi:uncharacterized membrane protein
MVLSSGPSQHGTVISGTSSSPSPRLARHRPGLVGLRPRRGWELHPGLASGGRLSLGDRAADRARDALGSWTFVAVAAGLVGVGVVMAIRHDEGAGPVAVLGLALSGVAVLGLSLLLMAARRADRNAVRLALHDLESSRCEAATIDEIRGEVTRLHADLARLAARLDTSRQRSEDEDF